MATLAATVIAGVATAARRLRSALSRIRDAVKAAESEDPHGAHAKQRLKELDREQDRLERAIADLAPTRDVTAFAAARSGGHDYREDYQQHLGVVSALRRDLETFAALLARERDRANARANARADDRTNGRADDRTNGRADNTATDRADDHVEDTADDTAGIERIVLYIDDLDRCPPKVVIQVLEAIHLLLALPVFAVVVGVDARWLTSAINQHYASLLDTSECFATNYVEKIFQIPFKLSTMDSDGFAQLVTELTASTQPSPAGDLPDQFTELPDTPTTPTQVQPTPRTETQAAEPQTLAVSSPEQVPILDMRPPQLAITAPERDFLITLAPLVRTPRSAKRLVNLYQLIRARQRGQDLTDFLDSAAYRPVLVLLAAQVGHPDEAPRLFRAIERTASGVSSRDALADFGPSSPLQLALAGMLADESLPPDLAQAGQYHRWLPLVTRFSFQTQEKTGPTTMAGPVE